MSPVQRPERENNASLPMPDFRAFFESAPGAFCVVLPDDPVFTIVAVSDDFVRLTNVRREDLLGRGVFKMFPDNPDNDAADGVRNLRASFRRVITTGVPDRMPTQRYDTQRLTAEGGGFEERYWSVLNKPVLGADGHVAYLLHATEEVTDRVRAEQRERLAMRNLRTSETRFRQLAETSTFGLVIGDFEGNVFHFNPTVRDLLGYTEEDVAAGLVRWDRLTPPEFASVDAQAVRQLAATGRCTPYEKAYVAKDGRRVPILVGASLLESADGRTEVAAFILDLTERKRREQRDAFLVRVDDALRLLTDPDKMMHMAAQLLGEHLQTDRCTYCQVEADEETFDILWDYLRPGMPSMKGRYRLTQFGTVFAQLLRACLPYIVEDIESDPSLTEFHAAYRQARVRAHASVPLGKTGKLVAIMAVHQQTPRQWRPDEVELVRLVADRCWEAIESTRVTRELRASEGQFRTLAETIPNLAWMAHSDGHIFWYNRRWYEYTGTEPAQMEGWGWQSVHDPKELPQVMERWKGSIASGQPFEMVFPLKSADGVFRSFLTRVEPIKDDGGRVVRWFGTNTDITDQKNTEEELRRANRELEEFAYVASHDLQEPLRMINIYTQLLLRQFGREDSEARQYAAFIRQGVSRMEELIRDLLAFSRTIYTEDLPAGMAELQDSLAEALAVLKSRIEECGATVTADPLPAVAGETRQLALVFQNLISNSLKYRQKGQSPRIHISAAREGDGWVIGVQDNGIGFDQRYAERIFGLFKRLHKDEYPGTGLGLAICQRIVERYGGRMWAQSSLGKGATFYFALPCAEEQ